jgi:hypothetical protein
MTTITGPLQKNKFIVIAYTKTSQNINTQQSAGPQFAWHRDYALIDVIQTCVAAVANILRWIRIRAAHLCLG